MSEPILCFVKNCWAYFTNCELSKQWGDDWNDAPYEHNAGEPYADDGVVITKLAFEADLETPADKAGLNSQYSVKEINAGAVAWLATSSWHDGEKVVISAGTTITRFKELIRKAGGKVYVEEKS